MRPIEKLIIGLFLGFLVAACARPLSHQSPGAQVIEQTLNTFWSAMRTTDQAALDQQLTPDAKLIRKLGRDPEVTTPLRMALKQPTERTLLSLAERAPLVNFEQSAPGHASLTTHLEVMRRDDIQRVRLQWDLMRSDAAWRLHRVYMAIWTFPRPPRGGGP